MGLAKLMQKTVDGSLFGVFDNVRRTVVSEGELSS